MAIHLVMEGEEGVESVPLMSMTDYRDSWLPAVERLGLTVLAQLHLAVDLDDERLSSVREELAVLKQYAAREGAMDLQQAVGGLEAALGRLSVCSARVFRAWVG